MKYFVELCAREKIMYETVSRNDNLNNKALEVNLKLLKMCQESKFDVIDPRTNLNKSRLHLNRNGYAIMGKNFVNLILKHHA